MSQSSRSEADIKDWLFQEGDGRMSDREADSAGGSEDHFSIDLIFQIMKLLFDKEQQEVSDEERGERLEKLVELLGNQTSAETVVLIFDIPRDGITGSILDALAQRLFAVLGGDEDLALDAVRVLKGEMPAR